jgi:hypothetical protein
MSLSALLVLHRRKRADRAAEPLFTGRRLRPFHLETCLRELWILDGVASSAARRLELGEDVERLTGTRAYEFLLRIACGLDSEIRGESDVFGQLRDAWRTFETDHADRAGVLAPLVQRLFEDVKEIRTRHLQGVTSTTYGGLVRHLLGAHATQPTLLVGAGRMAHAVVPYLAGRPLYLWNRSVERLDQLVAALPLHSNCDFASVQRLACTASAELDAWRRATNVVLCIPPDPETDASRIMAWQVGDRARGRIIHLGLLDTRGTAWAQSPGFATLTDLYALQTAHGTLRTLQLDRAAAACHEKATLRGLGGPISLAHGWEDLSLFASTG